MSLKSHRNGNFFRSPRFSGRSGPFFGASSLPGTNILFCTFGGFQFRGRLQLGFPYADVESLYFVDQRPDSLPDLKVRAFLKVPATPACGPRLARRAAPSWTASPFRGPFLESLDAVEIWAIPVSLARHPSLRAVRVTGVAASDFLLLSVPLSSPFGLALARAETLRPSPGVVLLRAHSARPAGFGSPANIPTLSQTRLDEILPVPPKKHAPRLGSSSHSLFRVPKPNGQKRSN
jgi:hypothetical protein